MLLNLVSLKEKKLVTKNDIIPWLAKRRPEVLLTLGAGDIDQLVLPLTEALDEMYPG